MNGKKLIPMIEQDRTAEREEAMEIIEILEDRGWIVEDFGVWHDEYDMIELDLQAAYSEKK